MVNERHSKDRSVNTVVQFFVFFSLPKTGHTNPTKFSKTMHLQFTLFLAALIHIEGCSLIRCESPCRMFFHPATRNETGIIECTAGEDATGYIPLTSCDTGATDLATTSPEVCSEVGQSQFTVAVTSCITTGTCTFSFIATDNIMQCICGPDPCATGPCPQGKMCYPKQGDTFVCEDVDVCCTAEPTCEEGHTPSHTPCSSSEAKDGYCARAVECCSEIFCRSEHSNGAALWVFFVGAAGLILVAVVAVVVVLAVLKKRKATTDCEMSDSVNQQAF